MYILLILLSCTSSQECGEYKAGWSIHQHAGVSVSACDVRIGQYENRASLRELNEREQDVYTVPAPSERINTVAFRRNEKSNKMKPECPLLMRQREVQCYILLDDQRKHFNHFLRVSKLGNSSKEMRNSDDQSGHL